MLTNHTLLLHALATAIVIGLIISVVREMRRGR